MNGIIVVIGSVTSKQYQSLRLELLRDGRKPKIVRLPADLFPVEQGPECESGYPDLREVAKMFGVSVYELEQADMYGPYETKGQHYAGLFREEFGFEVANVEAVVLPPDGEVWNCGEFNAIFSDIDVYQVLGDELMRADFSLLD